MSRELDYVFAEDQVRRPILRDANFFIRKSLLR
jgi:hypothetical protein